MKTLPNGQKLRGGFYTHPEIAKFLVNWAVQKPSANVLEPSCGDGVFFKPIIERLSSLGAELSSITNQITAVELDGAEAKKAFSCLSDLLSTEGLTNTYEGDFFTQVAWYLGNKRYNAIVGNPPFIRYQHFPDAYKEIAFRLMRAAGLHPTKLTNAWLPFIVVCTELLAEKGRIAMVVPAELLQVNYAAELRQFLNDRLDQLTIFTFRNLIFKEVQQEVILICGERNGGFNKGIRIIELDDICDLENYIHPSFEPHLLKPMDHSKEKWTQYFITTKQNQLIRHMLAYPGLHRFGQLAEVDVGIVTGLNDFFVLKHSQIEKIDAHDYVTPLVSRSSQLSGVEFTRFDWAKNTANDLHTFLLNIPTIPLNQLPEGLVKYIKDGEEKGYDKGYKCRIRNPWFKVPSVWVPDAFMLRQIHTCPRVITNSAKATSTDTIHRVRVSSGVNVKQLTGSVYNSLTFAFSEILGRSYGGGVLELEPREAEKLPIPYEAAKQLDIGLVDRLLRSGENMEALDYCDSTLLIEGLGLKNEDVEQLRDIWALLRNRRINRRFRKEKKNPPCI